MTANHLWRAGKYTYHTQIHVITIIWLGVNYDINTMLPWVWADKTLVAWQLGNQ